MANELYVEEDIEYTTYQGENYTFSEYIDEILRLWQEQVVEGRTAVDIRQPEAYNLAYVVGLLGFDKSFEINELRKGMNINTASGFFLEDMGARVGIYQQESTFATGTVVFTFDEPVPAEFTIDSGTIVTTDDTVIFYVVNDVAVSTGDTTVTANVVCDEAGIIGNVNAGTITNINDSLPVNATVTNPTACTGGVEDESDDDFRARIPDTNVNYPVGTVGWYEKIAETIVYQAKFIRSDSQNGIIYYHGNNITEEDLINLFQQKQYNNPAIELTFVPATPVDVLNGVSIGIKLLAGYVLSNVVNEINTELQTYLNNVPIGSLFESDNVKLIVESVDGVEGAIYTGLTDTQLTSSEYAEFTEPTYTEVS